MSIHKQPGREWQAWKPSERQDCVNEEHAVWSPADRTVVDHQG